MKRLLAMTLLWACCAAMLHAQYEPNTRWPYLYENFQQGRVFSNDGKTSEGQLNIHLWGNVLHYVNADGKIFQGSDRDVARVEIGPDTYLFSNHRLLRLVATEGSCMLAELTRGDFDSMQAGSGAYGASLNSSSARELSSLDLGGLDKPELGKMLQEKNDGRTIPLVREYYFLVNGTPVEANRKAVEKAIGADRAAEWRSFQKANKLKWKSEESLRRVLAFLCQ